MTGRSLILFQFNYKSSDTALTIPYTPISLLFLCYKILERIIHNKIIKHLVKHYLVSCQNQHTSMTKFFM